MLHVSHEIVAQTFCLQCSFFFVSVVFFWSFQKLTWLCCLCNCA